MRVAIFASIVAVFGVLGASPASAEDRAPLGPASVEIVESVEGPIFVTREGRSLYFYGADGTRGKSNCSTTPVTTMNDPSSGFGQFKLPGYRFIKSCAQVNPPFLADATARAEGDWTLFDRPEGTRQWVYRGRPLYTSSRDVKPGDRNGGGFGQGGRGALRLASPPISLPAELQLIRMGEDVVLADADRRPVYTPRGGRLQRACVGCEDLFAPVAAPALTKVSGDWSITGGQSGRLQYAFRGKPLYLQPEGLTPRDIEEAGGWDLVVLQKGPGLPSEIATRYNPVLGDIYTTKAGGTLYLYTCTSPGCDDPGGPAAYMAGLCGAECAQRWRPYLASPGAEPVGEWSIIDVADPLFTDPAGIIYPPEAPRVKAWAYKGRPVFTYYQDKEPGNIWGHATRWFAVSGFYSIVVPGREASY